MTTQNHAAPSQPTRAEVLAAVDKLLQEMGLGTKPTAPEDRPLTQEEQLALKYINAQGSATVTEVAAAAKQDLGSATTTIRSLAALGKIHLLHEPSGTRRQLRLRAYALDAVILEKERKSKKAG